MWFVLGLFSTTGTGIFQYRNSVALVGDAAGMISLGLNGDSLTHSRSLSRTRRNGVCEGAGKLQNLQIAQNGILHLAEQQEIWITKCLSYHE